MQWHDPFCTTCSRRTGEQEWTRIKRGGQEIELQMGRIYRRKRSTLRSKKYGRSFSQVKSNEFQTIPGCGEFSPPLHRLLWELLE